MKNIVIILLLSFISSYATGQSTADFERRLYTSYIDEKMADWKDIIDDMTVKYRENQDADLLYSLCFAQYGYIGYCISKDLEKEAKSSLNDAMKNSKKLEEYYQGRHDVLALQGSLIGLKIMLSKFSSLYLGPKAFKLINTASASSDKYFNCSLEIGNMRYFTPKFLGGSKEEAIDYYENAVELLELESTKENKNWMYINVNLFLANAYFDTGAKDLSCKQYDKILEYEPGARWIREEQHIRCDYE